MENITLYKDKLKRKEPLKGSDEISQRKFAYTNLLYSFSIFQPVYGWWRTAAGLAF